MSIEPCNNFEPLSSAYKPIGLLYRTIAEDICVHCSRRRADHDKGER